MDRTAVRTDIARSFQTTVCKVLIVELDSVLVPNRSACDLTENSAVSLHFNQGRTSLGMAKI